uniref:MFS transporter n=1 Tax=Natronococcus wangiae TaxID=3068275 RepID=UPI00387E32E3
MIGSFVVSFGIVKTVLSLYSGKWAEAYGRKPVLTLGRLAALPISFVLILAPNWWWVTLGNVLLDVNQGVAWSMSMIPKIELAGPDERGLAAGIDEAFGYTGDAVGAVLVGLTVDLLFIETAFYGTAVAMVLSGTYAFFRMDETHLEFGTHDPPE